METTKHLVDWLRDAHAMEKEAISILERQAERLEEFPEMQARIRQHVQETRSQADRVESCITRLNGGTSTIKDVTGKLMGNLAAMTNAMATDEVVKNAMADYAFEHFEIAAYKALAEAADMTGDRQTAEICRQIMREEEAMAKWMEEHLPAVTRGFLQQEMAI